VAIKVPDPEWCMLHMTRDLLFRQPEYARRGAYVEGRHDLPRGDRRYMQALSTLQRLAPTNYLGLVNQAVVQRMDVKGFKFGNEDGGMDEDATKIWVANDMDLVSTQIHHAASKYGLAYAMVSPPDENDKNKIPIITFEDPRQTLVYRNPTRPSEILIGLKMWTDDFTGKIMATLMTPDVLYLYTGPDKTHLENMTINQVINTLNGLSTSGQGFELTKRVKNPTKQVPLVEYVWRPGSGNLPQGECGVDVQIIQDRVNATMLDLIVISRMQAYKQRWATGVTRPRPGQDQEWDPGSDMVWVTKDKEAHFGEFQSADLRQISEAIRDAIADIAAVTQTPAHYLMGKLANVSGETLAQAETGLVKKTKLRMKSMGWSHERLMKLCFAYNDDPRATEVDAHVLWEDPEQNALVDIASAAAQLRSAEIPVQLVMERIGFTEEDIAFAEQELEKQQQLEQQQMQAQMDQQMQIAKMKPAAGGVGSGKTNPAAKKPSPNSTKKKPTKPAK